MGAVPVLYSVYAIIATLIAVRAQAPLKWRILTPFLIVFLLPFMSYAALKFGEAGMDVVKSVILGSLAVPALIHNFIKIVTSPRRCTRSRPATVS